MEQVDGLLMEFKRALQADRNVHLTVPSAVEWDQALEPIKIAHQRPDEIVRRVDTKRAEAAVIELLCAIGEDVSRPGLVDTPMRVAKYWREFMEYDPGKINTVFAEPGTGGGVVIVSGMRMWSLCEHHLMPFWCDMTVAYIPDGDKVVGLSKIPRICHKHAHGLQLQEKLVNQVATSVAELAGTENVMVVATGEHTCMVARGIRTAGLMTSSHVGGVFGADGMAADVMAQHRASTS